MLDRLEYLNSEQRTESKDFYKQMTTLWTFNNGASYRRNCTWSGVDHFSRLLSAIERVVINYNSNAKKCYEALAEIKLELKNAFGGPL